MTPLHNHLSQLGGEFLTYGPDEATAVRIPDSFGEFEAEYAAIRRRVGILVLAQQTVLQVTGEDRKDFLHRLVTQEINALEGGQTTRSLQLDTKGRVLADMLVHHGHLCTWLEMDRFHLPAVREILEQRLFTEDVELEHLDDRVFMVLIGPAALQLLAGVAEHTVETMTVESLGTMPRTTHVLTIDGVRVSATRWDMAGELAIRLAAPSDDAVAVHEKLLEAAGYEPDTEPDADFAERRRDSLRGRPIGWAAYNTARIEAGEVLFGVDFGTDCRPAEAGSRVMDETVSFTKGCYLGQEVVARMHNLGHPKRLAVGLRIDSDHLPVAGSQVLKATDDGPTLDVIGAITSSTTSPLQGGTTAAIAMMKWGQHRPGTKVYAIEVGETIEATVTEPGVDALRDKTTT
ncbi:CAF17-like 4Fe-4S cluster assembly/insertion protein YgfZ [Mucisphaera calidilacus]|uniref:Aminomethyltransferase n=1 Tax=Mucisphaera calidilacus TaxID=2527982 RepID=A0A518C0C0_9BACT|nr:glycine cleavage T C-terminal barrel domain-containing protein [Mucisphaera calidilacus]QDU72668.1 Aminomethyltransferase [Mucisphaera calidilacus]